MMIMVMWVMMMIGLPLVLPGVNMTINIPKNLQMFLTMTHERHPEYVSKIGILKNDYVQGPQFTFF